MKQNRFCLWKSWSLLETTVCRSSLQETKAACLNDRFEVVSFLLLESQDCPKSLFCLQDEAPSQEICLVWFLCWANFFLFLKNAFVKKRIDAKDASSGGDVETSTKFRSIERGNCSVSAILFFALICFIHPLTRYCVATRTICRCDRPVPDESLLRICRWIRFLKLRRCAKHFFSLLRCFKRSLFFVFWSDRCKEGCVESRSSVVLFSNQRVQSVGWRISKRDWFDCSQHLDQLYVVQSRASGFLLCVLALVCSYWNRSSFLLLLPQGRESASCLDKSQSICTTSVRGRRILSWLSGMRLCFLLENSHVLSQHLSSVSGVSEQQYASASHVEEPHTESTRRVG